MSFGLVEMCDCKCKCRKRCRKPNALSNESCLIGIVTAGGFRVFAPVVGTTCADSALLPPTGGARAGHNQPMCKHLQGEIQINYVIFEIKV